MFLRSRDVTATYGMALFGMAIAFVGVWVLCPSLRLPATVAFCAILLLGGWLIASRNPQKHGFKNLPDVAFSAIGEGVIATDRDGIVQVLNRAAEHLTGWTQAEIAGKNFGDVFHDCPTGVGEWSAEQLITRVVDENRDIGPPICSCLRTKNDELISVRQSAAPIHDKAGRVVGVVLVFEDARKRRAAEQRLNAEQSVTRMLAEATDFRTLVPQLLQTICESFQWNVAHFWEGHADVDTLVRTETWTLPGHADSSTPVSGATIQREEGVAGQAWSQKQAIWIEDGASEAADAAGFRAAFAFPIQVEDGIVGVLEFLARERRPRDSELIDTINSIASQIEQFIERIRAENAMRASEAHYRAIAETASDAFLTFDDKRKILFANRAAQHIFGYSIEELVGQDLATLVPDEISGLHPQGLAPGEQRLPWQSVEVRGRHQSGRHIPLEISIGEFVSDGRCVFTGIARDITERKRAENMLSQLAFIVESSNDAIIGMTLRGNIVSWNKGAEKLYGYAPNEVLGKSVSLLLPPEQADEQMTLLGKVAQGENVKTFETVRRRKNGDLIDVSLNVSPITNSTGRICGASAIARDISEHKRDEAELERQKGAAEAASRAKDQFLAVLSHELRTPLTPVLAGIESLDDEPQSPEARQILAAMRRNIELEARLIDDLLDLTRVNRGKLQLTPGLIDVHAAILHVEDICKHDSGCKKLEVNLRLNAGQHCVEADSARLHQIFWNLLQNAVKFTDKGGLITIVTSNPTPGEIVVTVQDSGIGIDPSAMSRIFDPFEQGERSIQRRFGGLGLGLAITKALVDAHGGQLSASSKGKGKGATFTVSLKTSARRPNEKKITLDTSPVASVSGCKILLVEDHDDTREAVHRLLTRRGYSVTVAATMREGLVAGTREEFDFLISDIGLPDGSGHVLMNELRRISGVKGIALSGFGMDSDLERSRQSGFSEHLTKPLNLEKLEETMRKLRAAEPVEQTS